MKYKDVILRPIEVYVNAVEMMAFLSKMGWNNYIKHSTGISGDHFLTEAAMFPTLPGDDEASWLPAKYAISGLYQAGVEIAVTQNFKQSEVGLYFKDAKGDEKKYGYLAFRPKKPFQRLLADSVVETNLTETSYRNDNLATSRQQGNIIDPTDKKFYITYEWHGNKLKSQELFVAFLNALSIASTHDNADTEASVPNAPSAGWEITLSTWLVDGPNAAEMTWARLKRALQLIWGVAILGVPKPRFEDLSFELWYDAKGRGPSKGEKIGAGRVWKFDETGDGGVSGSTDLVATS